MLVAWRVTKLRHVPYDGTGARLHGARWNAPGRPVIYAADSYAGAILEILAHALRPRTLPGRHHGIRIEIPDELVARIEGRSVPGWDERESLAARAAGERWLEHGRSAVLVVPALPARPHGRNILINPRHPDADRIVVSRPFPVPWDERLF
jgi:RES domain-containing protein